MTSKIDKLYPFKVWITILLVGPVLVLFCAQLFDDEKLVGLSSWMDAWFTTISYSLIYSIPILLVCYIVFWVAVKAGLSELTTKITLVILVSFTILGMMILMGVDLRDIFNAEGWYLPVVYITSVAVVAFCYNIHSESTGHSSASQTH